MNTKVNIAVERLHQILPLSKRQAELNAEPATGNGNTTSPCTEKVFFQGKREAEQWQEGDTDNNEIFDLFDSVDFIAVFIMPMMPKQLA